MERVICSRIGQFNARVKHAQKENSLSYCVNACNLCKSEQAIRGEEIIFFLVFSKQSGLPRFVVLILSTIGNDDNPIVRKLTNCPDNIKIFQPSLQLIGLREELEDLGLIPDTDTQIIHKSKGQNLPQKCISSVSYGVYFQSNLVCRCIWQSSIRVFRINFVAAMTANQNINSSLENAKYPV